MFPFDSSNDVLKKRISYSGSNPEYIGEASPGISEDEPKWRIKKFQYDDSNNVVAINFANGTSGFQSAWSSRATLPYS